MRGTHCTKRGQEIGGRTAGAEGVGHKEKSVFSTNTPGQWTSVLCTVGGHKAWHGATKRRHMYDITYSIYFAQPDLRIEDDRVPHWLSFSTTTHARNHCVTFR